FFAGVGGGVFILGQAMVVPLFGVSLYMIAINAQTRANGTNQMAMPYTFESGRYLCHCRH
ncbi:MAG: hypothetical protein P8M68_02280, partial [Aquiluna sp.]|nr:hypothetical protein [Aquiluna sp.]